MYRLLGGRQNWSLPSHNINHVKYGDSGVLWQHCERRLKHTTHFSDVVLGQPGAGCKDFSTKIWRFLSVCLAIKLV
tara:strand:+ start:292 stop:519 length:228 start_codon:yes stop_codon:yes gene_type:complete